MKDLAPLQLKKNNCRGPDLIISATSQTRFNDPNRLYRRYHQDAKNDKNHVDWILINTSNVFVSKQMDSNPVCADSFFST